MAKITLKEYFLKISPDFSVFDLLEKFLVSNELSDEQKGIFFYRKDELTDDVLETNFYRAIFKIDINSTNEEDYPKLSNSEKNYVIIKDEEYILDGVNHKVFFIIGSDNDLLEIDGNGIDIYEILGVAF